MGNGVTSIAALNELLKKHVESAMTEHVAEVVKNEESHQVHKVVYNRYRPSPQNEPWRYERREDDGGLSDTNNMVHDISRSADGVAMTITNTTMGAADEMQIADLVEGGDGTNGKHYNYRTNRSGDADKYLAARAFQQATIDELQKSGEVTDAIKKSLIAKGYKVF